MEIAPELAHVLTPLLQQQQSMVAMLQELMTSMQTLTARLTRLEERLAGLQRQGNALQDAFLHAPDVPRTPLETITGADLLWKEWPDDDDAC